MQGARRNRRPAAETEERILAVDFGSRRIGLAVGHVALSQAVPLETLHLDAGGAAPEAQVADIARREGVSRILLGLPLNMDGTEGRAARRTRAFGRRLETAAGLALFFVDERLTSEAARDLSRAGRARKGRAIDDLAAVILMESWMADEAARRARLLWNEPESGS